MKKHAPFLWDNTPFYWKSERPYASHAILLLHGLGGGVFELKHLASNLHQMGYSVQGINYPGHDKPFGKMPVSTWQEWYGHIKETYDQLAMRYEQVSLVGFSTGCPLALKLAAHHPVNRLVLMSPFLEIKRPLPFFNPALLAYGLSPWLQHLPKMPLPTNDPDIRRQAEALRYIDTFHLETVCSALALIEEVKPMVGSIQSPTLIFQSKRDRVVDPQGAAYLYKHLGAEQKELIWLHRSNHTLTLDVERNQVHDKLCHFFKRQ